MTTAEIISLLTVYGVGETNMAVAINDSGTVVLNDKQSNVPTGIYVVTNGAYTYIPSAGGSAINDQGVLVGSGTGSASQITAWYAGAVAVDLIAGGASGNASAIDDQGDIAGYVYQAARGNSEAFALFGNQVSYLGTLNNATSTTTVDSEASGINAAGQVVGSSVFQNGSDLSHAFLWQKGVMTDLGVLPGGDASHASAINAGGQIVGWSGDGVSGHIYTAVTWRNGVISALGMPSGDISSYATALNDQGQIVGYGFDSFSHQSALLWENGQVIDLNSYLAAGSNWVLQAATGINDQGLIVGYGLYYGNQTAFEMSLDGVSTPLHTFQAVWQLFQSGISIAPQSVIDSAFDISENIDLLQMIAHNGALASIAFSDGGTPVLDIAAEQFIDDKAAIAKLTGAFSVILDTGAPNLTLTGLSGHGTTIQFDDPSSDYAVSVIDGGTGFQVVDTGTGRASTDIFHTVSKLTFTDGAVAYAGPQGAVFVSEVTLVNGATSLASVNNQGQGVGFTGTNLQPLQEKGFYWSAGTQLSLSPLIGGAQGSAAYGINDQGLIVGQSYAANTVGGSSTAVYWKVGDLLADDPIPTSIGWLPGDFASIAIADNDQGDIVGTSYTTSTAYHGFLWRNGSMLSLGSLGGSQTDPLAINGSDLVTGKAATASGAFHAFSWQNGTLSDLGVLAGGGASCGEAVNRAGTIVGYSTDASGNEQAVCWSNGQIHALADLTNATAASANAVNDAGWIVGTASDGSGTAAVLWADGAVLNLNSFLPANSGWILGTATSITDAGVVSGIGSYQGVTTPYQITLPSSLHLTSGTAVLENAAGQLSGGVDIADSAANIAANIDGLANLAAKGDLASLTLTDAGVPNLTVTQAQFQSDAAVLNDIAAAHTVTVQMPGTAAQYDFATTGQFAGASALQFDDRTVLVAAAPGTGSVTTGNVTELYSAVLDREPDIAGLAFYQTYLKANPGTPLIQFAEWFLQSSEYAATHDYAPTSAGDQQFIIDSYQNLLGRTPTAAEIAYYQTNVMAAGGQSHAQMLVYFSASAEFLKDVQITAAQPADAQHWLVLT